MWDVVRAGWGCAQELGVERVGAGIRLTGLERPEMGWGEKMCGWPHRRRRA